ncbi:MAG TPA: ribokinase [Desertimonas sp.]|nr:ribokinase [Desertimonas sp.]
MTVERPPFDVCVVGSSNLDLVVTAPRHPQPGETLLGTAYHEYPGGKGLNQAVAAARAGPPTTFVSALGDDAAGDRLAMVLAEEAIDATAVQRCTSTATGRALITVDHAGENSIVVVPGANAELRPAPLPDAIVVLGQLEIPMGVVADAFAQARAGGRVTILNPAPAVTLPDELLGRCTIVIPNEHEREALGGVDRCFDAGVEAVITTLGGEGVEVHTPDGHRRIPPFSVTPIDTTGAGDAFCGAFAVAIAGGADPFSAARFAAAAGALATTRAGAVPSLPRRREIEALLAS